MARPDDLLIAARSGFSPLIGHLVSMLGYARLTTLGAVRGLSQSALDHRHDAMSNSIAMLLEHIAAVEWVYQITSFEEREPTPEEMVPWLPGLKLGEHAQGIGGQELGHYLDKLDRGRARTLEALSRRDDSWLLEEKPFWDDLPSNAYFMWFHVLEDEINHRGQIRWLRRRLPR